MKFSSPLNWEHFNSQYEETEKLVKKREGSYQGLSAEALYTSAEDLLRIFSHDLVQGTFLDLGCGDGRTSLLYGSLFPERQSLGIEFEKERLKVGDAFKEKNQLKNVTLLHADLLSADIPKADTYFLYFPTGPVLDRVLTTLYEGKAPFRLVVVESHGDLFPRIHLENWLTLKDEIPLSSPRHHPAAKIFERLFVTRDEALYPFTLSYQKNYLLIEEKGESWIGDSLGMEWTSEDRFELMTPPRTIFWKNVKKMMTPGVLTPEMKLALKLRTEGEVTITTAVSHHQGFIRKICVGPTFGLEISSGEKVEWDKILTITQGSLLCYESSLDF